MPELDYQHLPYATIKGQVKLKHYLGVYNRAKVKIYGRVKFQSKLAFLGREDNIVDWLRQDLHCVKEYYIQARQISNIGLLAGMYNVVDLKRTREALERAVANEIHCDVKLNLKLRKVRWKHMRGNNVTATIYGVTVDIQ